jgi:hypothetical protein
VHLPSVPDLSRIQVKRDSLLRSGKSQRKRKLQGLPVPKVPSVDEL